MADFWIFFHFDEKLTTFISKCDVTKIIKARAAKVFNIIMVDACNVI